MDPGNQYFNYLIPQEIDKRKILSPAYTITKRAKIFSVDEVKSWYHEKNNQLFYESEYGRVQMKMKYLSVFMRDDFTCKACGRRAIHIALETVNDGVSWFLKPYTLSRRLKEVTLTADHIHPRSKYGPDKKENLQAMCYTCNQKKEDRT